MRGADLINAALPDHLLEDVIRLVGAGCPGGGKRDLDACALVCRRWRRLERASRRSARLAASGERADEVLRLVADRFPALADVSVDERLTAAGVAGAGPRSRRSRQVRPAPSWIWSLDSVWFLLVAPPRADREKWRVFLAMIELYGLGSLGTSDFELLLVVVGMNTAIVVGFCYFVAIGAPILRTPQHSHEFKPSALRLGNF